MTGNTVVSDYKHTDGDIALEATQLIQRMYRHVLVDNCDHCRAVLNNNEAGLPSPAPNTQPDSTPIPAQIPTEQRSDIK